MSSFYFVCYQTTNLNYSCKFSLLSPNSFQVFWLLVMPSEFSIINLNLLQVPPIFYPSLACYILIVNSFQLLKIPDLSSEFTTTYSSAVYCFKILCLLFKGLATLTKILKAFQIMYIYLKYFTSLLNSNALVRCHS